MTCPSVVEPAGEASGTPPRSRKRTKQGVYISDITYERLAALFHSPTEVATRELGLGITSFKKLCRRFGIYRWPYRTNKKLQRANSASPSSDSADEGGYAQLRCLDVGAQQKAGAAGSEVRGMMQQPGDAEGSRLAGLDQLAEAAVQVSRALCRLRAAVLARATTSCSPEGSSELSGAACGLDGLVKPEERQQRDQQQEQQQQQGQQGQHDEAAGSLLERSQQGHSSSRSSAAQDGLAAIVPQRSSPHGSSISAQDQLLLPSLGSATLQPAQRAAAATLLGDVAILAVDPCSSCWQGLGSQSAVSSESLDGPVRPLPLRPNALMGGLPSWQAGIPWGPPKGLGSGGEQNLAITMSSLSSQQPLVGLCQALTGTLQDSPRDLQPGKPQDADSICTTATAALLAFKAALKPPAAPSAGNMYCVPAPRRAQPKPCHGCGR